MGISRKVVFVGGGSIGWFPKLINDFLRTAGLEDLDYWILDIDETNGLRMLDFARRLSAARGIPARFLATTDEEIAFEGADFILITISTGGLDAMEKDLVIPEDFGIYQTVGDTVGPGGWARALRNLPVFERMARRIRRLCPDAVVLNYSNPLAPLTKVFSAVGHDRAVGLCHGLFGAYDDLRRIFGLKSEKEIRLRIAGVNHFFWILDLSIGGQEGYGLLDEQLAGRDLDALLKEAHRDDAGYDKDRFVTSELYREFHRLPFIDDRHICEFLPRYIVRDPARIAEYHLRRTSAEERREDFRIALRGVPAEFERMTSGAIGKSHEAAADIVAAFVLDQEFVDVVNLPNEGQVANLPRGCVVETLGVVNRLGFTPLTAGPLPEPILDLVLPHARNQDRIVEAGLSGDVELALKALANDPLCAHLSYPQVRAMGLRLLRSQQDLLPQFAHLG